MFFKIESRNFQVHFEIEYRETSQNFNSFSLFRQLLFQSLFLSVVWLSWNFARFHEIQFQIEPESSAFYLKKQKSFIHKKNFQSIVKTKKLCLLTQFSRRFWLIEYKAKRLRDLTYCFCVYSYLEIWYGQGSGCIRPCNQHCL